MTATVAPANATDKSVTWTSSDEAKATVVNGHVIALAAGNPTITVTTTDGGKTATCELTISNVAVTGISLNKDAATIYKGSVANTVQLIPTITPDNATIKTVSWESSDETVATVDENGLVTAVAEGTATITVTTTDGNFTATCAITVETAPGSAEKPYTVAEAIAFINTLGSETSAEEVYVSGIISQVDSYNSKYSSIQYWISDDGTTTGQMEVYSGKGLNGADFTAITDLAIGDIVTVKGYVKKYNSTPEFTQNNQLVSFERPVVPSITLAQYEYNLNSNGGDAELPVTCSNLADDPQLAVVFVESDGETAATYDWISASINGDGNIDGHIDVNTGDARTAYFKVSGKDANDNTVYSKLVTITQTAANPSITVEKGSIDFEAGGESDRKLSFEYESLGNSPTFEVVFFEQDGTTPATYDWVTTATIENNKKVSLTVAQNDGAARTAYFKVHAIETEVYSNLVTINQAKYVVDYATLPFEWDSKTTPTGVTNNGVTTYNSSPYLKFDETGENIILKINEEPATLTFDIKGNSFSKGTFKVQTSADGVDYDDLETYTELGTTQSETFQLASNVRYIKWIYTEKVNGNVALGSIVVTAPMSVNLNAYGYATFASEYALDFTTAEAAGYSAWQITNIDNKVITFSQITGAVAAGTGVLLKGEVSDQVSITRTATGVTLDENKLVGITTATAVEADQYYGLKGEKFVQVNAGTVPAGKALLPASAITNAARELTFVFEGETTGIRGIENSELRNENSFFDLQGRKIAQPKKGLYIMNGKKVIMK